MKIVKYWCVIAAIIFTYNTGHAQNPDLGLNDYLEMAAKNNPSVQAAFKQSLAAMEKVPQVGSMPDPQMLFGLFVKPMQLLAGNQRANLELMQMFPWFGTLKTAKNEATLMARAKYEAFNSVKAELFYQVKESWYKLMKYDKEMVLIRQNLELLESLEKMATIKFQSPVGLSPDGKEGGQTGLQDVLRVKMEILEQKNSLDLLTDQRKTEEEKFNSLLNRDLSNPVLISDSLVAQTLPFNLPFIKDSILNRNPMLAMLGNEAGSYSYMEQKAKKMGLPMLGLGINYMVIQKREGLDPDMNGKDMFMPMVSVSVPIFRKKYTAMQNEARLMQDAVNLQTQDLKNNLMVQYRQYIENLSDAERRIKLYKEQEDLARKTTDLLLEGFATTGNDYEEVLRMQMKVLDYGFKQVEAITDYNTSVAMVEKLMNYIEY